VKARTRGAVLRPAELTPTPPVSATSLAAQRPPLVCKPSRPGDVAVDLLSLARTTPDELEALVNGQLNAGAGDVDDEAPSSGELVLPSRVHRIHLVDELGGVSRASRAPQAPAGIEEGNTSAKRAQTRRPSSHARAQPRAPHLGQPVDAAPGRVIVEPLDPPTPEEAHAIAHRLAALVLRNLRNRSTR
jgi:hypothetical protein